jgi:hypothetical protein
VYSLGLAARLPMHTELEVHFCSRVQVRFAGPDPLLAFFGELAKIGQAGCEVIAQVGFVNVLLSIFLHESKDSRHMDTFYQQVASKDRTIQIVCRTLLGRTELVEDIELSEDIVSHEHISRELIMVRNTRKIWDAGLTVTMTATNEAVTIFFENGASGSFRVVVHQKLLQAKQQSWSTLHGVDQAAHRLTDTIPIQDIECRIYLTMFVTDFLR